MKKARIIILIFSFLMLLRAGISQVYTSLDKHTGNWESASTWSPTWNPPLTIIESMDVSIKGYVSRNGSLEFAGSENYLRVYDTLVIYGNLTLKNNNKLFVYENGVLIVRGNLTLANQADVHSHSYVVITGDFIKDGSGSQGSFYTESPTDLFVGGSVQSGLSGFLYPALDCPGPYAHSHCNYGNNEDLAESPIYSFFQSTCNVAITSSSSPMCKDETRTLTANPVGGTFSVVSGPGTINAGILTAIAPGTIIIKYTDFGRCNNSTTQNITVNSLPSPSLTVTDNSGVNNNDGIICNGQSATLTASGGTSYLWSTGESSSQIIKSSPGTYSVTVTNTNNCKSTISKTITVNSLPTSSISISENSGVANNDGVLCFGASATLTASGGVSYLWSSGETSTVITKSLTGTYAVIVTDANNCKSTSNKIITVNSLPAVSITISENSGVLANDGIVCSGANTTLSATGGSSYLWSSGETVSEIIKSVAGTYTVTATDVNNCQNTYSKTITVNALPTVAISISETSGILNNDGIICQGATATLAATGGTSYLWSSGETLSAITKSNAGTFTVTATDNNKCINTASSTISVNALPVVDIAVSENSGLWNNDGTACQGANVTLTATGGVSYSWSSGETLSEIIKNAAGTYTVTATDAINCQNTNSSTIVVNPLPPVSISVSENSGVLANDGIVCIGANTTLSATGGSSYVWSSGETVSEIIKSVAGTYTVTATDVNNCQNTYSKTITVNALPTVSISISETSGILNNDGIICQGATATLSATGGTSYLWSSGETLSAITKSSAGTFTVTATDDNKCINTASSTISVNTLPVVGIAVSENSGLSNNDGTVCQGANVTLTATGGVSYSWSSGETLSEIIKNAAGTYTVTATDANNCQNTNSSTIVVNSLPAVSITVSENSGVLANDGIVCSGANTTLSATGGSSYVWSSGETVSEIIKSVAGTYTVTATDLNNCQNTYSNTITVNALPTVAISISETSGILNNDGIICQGATATLAATGGTSYLWSSGETLSAITKSNAGTFSVTATDNNKCINSASSTISVNALPVVEIAVSDNSGLSNNDGTMCQGANVTLTATGGVSYSWSSGETLSEIIKNTAGTYTVTATDANNCQNTNSSTIVVNPLPPVSISVSENSGVLANDGIVCIGANTTLSATGGSSYVWSSGETVSEIIKSVAGTYTVTATDANNCQNTYSKTITVNALPTVAIYVSETSGILNNDGIICQGATATLSATGGTSYLWSSGETSSEIFKSIEGLYTVTITDDNKCSNTSSSSIKVNSLPSIAIKISEDSGLLPNDGIICNGTIAILTAVGNDSYKWSTGKTGSELQTSDAGTYSVIATSTNGCSNSAIASISTVKVVSFAGNDSDICGTECFLQANAGTGVGTWSISGGSGNLFFTNVNNPLSQIKTDAFGTYKLTWTVVNENCTSGSDVNISFYEPPLINAGLDQDLNYAFSTKLNAELLPGFHGSWSVFSGSANINNPNSPFAEVSNLSTGENKFIWTVSSDKCSTSDTIVISVSDLFIPNVITPDGDNKNNFLVIKDIEKNSPVELIIFNKWGDEVYRNNDYNNTWDGRNKDNTILPNDTYFYILRLGSGKVIKSFVVIKR